jgi:hypothetical protein
VKYILSDEELSGLVPRTELEAANEALEVARVKLLQALAYTCIHDQPRRERYPYHCDDCPVAGMKAEAGRLICKKTKSWSK